MTEDRKTETKMVPSVPNTDLEQDEKTIRRVKGLAVQPSENSRAFLLVLDLEDGGEADEGGQLHVALSPPAAKLLSDQLSKAFDHYLDPKQPREYFW